MKPEKEEGHDKAGKISQKLGRACRCDCCALFLQAHCDLTLPEYTSKIVNEGIQQKGIVTVCRKKMSAGTKANLELF